MSFNIVPPTEKQQDVLFRARIPAEGLTQRQAGWIIGLLHSHDWRIPHGLEWLKGYGSMSERKHDYRAFGVLRDENGRRI